MGVTSKFGVGGVWRWLGRLFVVVLGVVSLLGSAVEGKPNILFLFVDDLGFNDLGYQGSPDVTSPNIDQLAAGGAIFWNAYAMAGFCSPSRAGLMTGQSPALYGYVFNPPHDQEDTIMGLPPGMTIMPQTLNKAGYDSYILGKWHLGYGVEQHPLKRGFNDFFGFLLGQFPYFESTFFHNFDQQTEYLYDKWAIPETVSYLTDDLTDKAIEYMDRSHNQGNEFFIYLSYNAPHGPFEFKPEDVDPTVAPERQKHVAMIKAIDDNVGRLMDHLTNLGILENTLVIFTNDNGGHDDGTSNFPLREYKGSFFEGGIRVPFIVSWKDTIEVGQNLSHPITLMDLYPTFQAAGEVAPADQNPDLEGSNLLPFITMVGETEPEDPGVPHDHLCISAREKGMVRKDEWKLHIVDDVSLRLYNLVDDIGESNNLVDIETAKRDELTALYAACDAVNVPFLFPRERRVNPVTTTLTAPVERIIKGVPQVFEATAVHANGGSMTYVWEVFRLKQIHQANYKRIRVSAAPFTLSEDELTATFTFNKLGKFIVRFMVKEGEWYKWSDVTVQPFNS